MGGKDDQQTITQTFLKARGTTHQLHLGQQNCIALPKEYL
jgi:hypothetical protein